MIYLISLFGPPILLFILTVAIKSKQDKAYTAGGDGYIILACANITALINVKECGSNVKVEFLSQNPEYIPAYLIALFFLSMFFWILLALPVEERFSFVKHSRQVGQNITLSFSDCLRFVVSWGLVVFLFALNLNIFF